MPTTFSPVTQEDLWRRWLIQGGVHRQVIKNLPDEEVFG